MNTLKSLLALALILSSFAAKAENTALPVGVQIGQWMEQSNKPLHLRDMLSIQEDGTVEMQSSFIMNRNTNNSDSSICTIVETGRFKEIVPTTLERKEQYLKALANKVSAPNFTLKFDVHSIRNASISSQNIFCADYVKEKANLMNEWGLGYTREVDFLIDDKMNFLEMPWYEIIFQRL